jgi:hypothetical protein
VDGDRLPTRPRARDHRGVAERAARHGRRASTHAAPPPPRLARARAAGQR